MKSIKKIALVLLQVSLSLSCGKGYFNEIPDDQLTIEKTFQSKATAEEFLANVYSQMPDEAHAHSAPDKNAGPWIAASDEAEYCWGYMVSNNINIGAYDASSNFVAAYWGNFYQGIRNASVYLLNIDKVTDMTSALKVKRKAEARALRAIYYFNLMRIYGPIVLLNNVIAPDEPLSSMQLSRSSFDECVSYVTAELDNAAKDLPARPDADEYGRITSGYVLAIKSEVLLFAASPLFNGNPAFSDLINKDGKRLISGQYDANKWKLAADAAKAFMDAYVPSVYNLYRENDTKGNYSPYLSCRDVFLVDWNPEVIYARIEASITDRQYDTTPYHQGSPDAVRGASSLGATQNMVDAYFMANGRPIDDPASGYVSTGESMFKAPFDDQQRMTYNQWANREPRFYVGITYNGARWLNPNVPGLITGLYVDGNSGRATGGNDYSATGYIVRKNTTTGDRTVGGRTWVMLRLAEIYLNYAEALNEYNPGNPDILKYLNLIRSRAGITTYGDGIPVPASQTEMREAIRKERRVELAFENNRYFDVRRWMIAPETDNGPIYGLNINARLPEFYQRTAFEYRVFQKRNYFFPIPQIDINNDKQLVQNPGW
ncbi:RagB/SusD family nutrient uptake outer membrane protein [Mucilaginibacter celer]|uniref:RagB/SusD family nutrient uptake outer membrane protein n=1 Tax=Mucilaginibacter celer TaxID=2305508 RepID=A0A494VVY7_9SPHI|nr:RagB/SusD family nutrient uptake outer membrane protein [Mucilaginibacter celer]AYL95425.1 RagB/SusD family nutrient uptake outer membrane protein [Mucilaginibacter celer]